MTQYTFAKIPLSGNITVTQEFENIDDARLWAKNNLDTTKRWIIKVDGRNIGDAFQFTKYLAGEKRIFNYNPTHWFDTLEESMADYNKYREEANKKLDAFEIELSDLLEKQAQEYNALLEKHNCGVDSDDGGYTESGYWERGYYNITTKINNYTYTKKLDTE